MPLGRSTPQRHLRDNWTGKVGILWAEDLITGGSGIPGALVMTEGHWLLSRM